MLLNLLWSVDALVHQDLDVLVHAVVLLGDLHALVLGRGGLKHRTRAWEDPFSSFAALGRHVAVVPWLLDLERSILDAS